MGIWNWLHILTAYFIHIAIAIVTSVVIRKTSSDLKDFSVRNSPQVLLLHGYLKTNLQQIHGFVILVE
jgi:hypothetical protein